MVTLYGAALSPFVRKVLILVEEGNLTIEYRKDVTPFPPNAELAAINPRGKIPALTDGDLKLGESSVICAYLDRRYGPTGLYPEDPVAYARALWFEKYCEECLMPAVGPVFFQRVLQPMLGNTPDDAAVTEALEQRQPPVFDYLDGEIADRTFLAGGAFSIGDAAVVSAFINLELAGEVPDPERYPNLVRYLAAQYERPSVAKWRHVAMRFMEKRSR